MLTVAPKTNISTLGLEQSGYVLGIEILSMQALKPRLSKE